MLTEAIALVSAAPGVVLDTTTLLLEVSASLDPSLIVTFKRVRSIFQPGDENVLRSFTSAARSIWTTPHVMAEAGGLLGQLPEIRAHEARKLMLDKVSAWSESYTPTASASDSDEDQLVFCRLGTADWGLIRAARSGLVIITTDALLADAGLRLGVQAINFNHHRAW
jgi:hypothetical protein